MKGRCLQTGLWVIGAGLVLTLGHVLPLRFEGRLPQIAGEDVLALILGDARLEFSRALEEKADDYFHGGVRHLECTMADDAAEHPEHEAAEHDETSHDKADGHHDEALPEVSGQGDWWQWIDANIHVQVHRHLHGGQGVEVLPWLWAACRMSPKNVQAYESGAYVLSRMLEKPAEAVKLLEEGVRQNPGAPELDFSLGEILVNQTYDRDRAEACFEATRAKCAAIHRDDGQADDRLLLRLRSLFYLGYFAKQRGDVSRLRACLAEAESLNPHHNVTHDLRKMLAQP